MALLDVCEFPLQHIALYGIASLIGYAAIVSIYRLFLHPLARYPGPLTYKLSGWPLVWQAYRGNRHIWHLKDHEKYGPIVRIAPNTLSFNTASALSAIYGPRSANVKKGEWYKTFDIAAGTYSSFTETDKGKHAAKRRWISPVFSVESLKTNESAMINTIDSFCEYLKPHSSDWGPKWNMSLMATYLGFDIMGGLVFGSDFKSVQKQGNRDLADSILPATKFLYWLSHLPLAVLVRPLLRTRLFEVIGGESVVGNNRLIDYANHQVQSRYRTGDEREEELVDTRSDFLTHMMGHGDKSTGWQPATLDLNTECLNMMNAGADPYSGVLAGAIFYLVHNQDALRKATYEVRSIFSSADEIRNSPKLNSCMYLYACIEETASNGSDDQHLPKDTVVGVSTYAIHHHPAYFPDPWAFRPERWVESDTVSHDSIKLARRAFNPFSLGARQCVGKTLAYLQLKLTLARVLYQLDMRLAPDELGRGGGGPGLGVGRERKDEFQLWDAFGFGRDGPMVQFKCV